MITFTQEDYLRAIYRLNEDTGLAVKSTDLANKLDLSKSTVSQRLKELQAAGFIDQIPYGPINFTDLGQQLAQNLTYKHRLIELYLITELKIDPKDVHEEAHLLEHAVSDQVILKMAAKLNHPTHCPHGKPLPKFEPLMLPL